MNYVLAAILSTLGLLTGILVMMEFGRRLGVRRLAEYGGDAVAGVAAVEGGVFALLGLLLAFTFSGAATRFDTRRQQIVEEANDIGTAYLRIDLLPADSRPELRETFRRYTDSRIIAYRKFPDFEAVRAELARGADLQKRIWTQAVEASRAADSPAARMLLLPALNEMFDITTTRTFAAQVHPPALVFVMLLILVLASSFLAGHAMATAKYRGRLHMLCFAVVMSATAYIILDFEFPRLGLMRIDGFDQVMVDVRAGMK
jgi:hypothetical protein